MATDKLNSNIKVKWSLILFVCLCDNCITNSQLFQYFRIDELSSSLNLNLKKRKPALKEIRCGFNITGYVRKVAVVCRAIWRLRCWKRWLEESNGGGEEEEGAETEGEGILSNVSGYVLFGAAQWSCLSTEVWSGTSSVCCLQPCCSSPGSQRLMKTRSWKTASVTTTREDTSIPGRLSACRRPITPCTSARPRVITHTNTHTPTPTSWCMHGFKI